MTLDKSFHLVGLNFHGSNLRGEEQYLSQGCNRCAGETFCSPTGSLLSCLILSPWQAPQKAEPSVWQYPLLFKEKAEKDADGEKGSSSEQMSFSG